MILDNLLEKIAHIQTKHYALVLIITLIFTIIVGSGIALIQVESDFSKEMPQDFPITKLNNTITDKFGGQDIIILVLRIDQNSNANNTIQDIRDPTVTDYLITLENELKTKTEINNVTSVGTILKNFNPKSIEQTKTILSNIPEATSFYNKDYTATIIYVTSELGENNNRVIAITDLVNEKINDISLPPGTKINITGEPPIKVTLLDILVKDAIYTLLLSTIFIIILVYLFERSLKNTAIIVTPIFLGIIWTMGLLGLLNIKLSVATVGIGAMILGLGIEYGVFILTRYNEERNIGKSQSESLKISLPIVGSAIMGSGLTTIVGFAVLSLSIMPVLQHLGQSLALGIFFCLLAAIFVEPCLIILSEKLYYKHTKYKHNKYSEELKKHERNPL